MLRLPGTSTKRIVACLLLLPVSVYGAPQGGTVVGGAATITQNGNVTSIQQGSDKAAIDWSSFNVSRDELVQFLQPGTNSIALNRILDGNASVILGRVQANGRIFLVNPRGIIFGDGAQIDTAGLVASTLDINAEEFMRSNRINAVAQDGTEGVIVNEGLIEASVGGSVTLLGRVIRNDGEIRVERGHVNLIGADRVVIQFDALGGYGIEVTQATQQNVSGAKSQVDVGGKVSADGGYVLIEGASAAALFDHAVNTRGIVEARSLQADNGVIELRGNNGDVAVSGTLDTSSVDEGGLDTSGEINISANTVDVTGKLNASAHNGNGGNARIVAGEQARLSGNASVDVSSAQGRGGVIEIKAEQRVGVLDQTQLRATGGSQGGVVHVGGDFRGAGNVTAQRTVVGAATTIDASATTNGDGGEVVVWADDYTYFAGAIAARGGALGGNGGSVEVSGKNSLGFYGMVDTSAVYGEFGELLLDPAVINIINGSGGARDAFVADGVILSGDAPSPYQISEQALEALTTNVTLTATQQINIANLADNELLFNPNGGTVTFNISSSSGTSGFVMADVNDTIRVNNGNLVISENNSANSGDITFTIGNLATTGSGNININATSQCSAGLFFSCSGGSVSINTGTLTSAGSVTVYGESFGEVNSTIFGAGLGGTVSLATGNIAAAGAVTMTALSDGGVIGFGAADSSATSVTVAGITVSNSSNVQITSNSTQHSNLENLVLGGNITTQSSGSSIALNSGSINLGANVLLQTDASNASGGNITLTGTLLGNGNDFSTSTGNGVASVGWTSVNNLGAVSISQDGDISLGSDISGSLDITQAMLNRLSSQSTALTVQSKGEVVAGDTTISNIPVTIVADSDNFFSGGFTVTSGRSFTTTNQPLAIHAMDIDIAGNLSAGTSTLTITASNGVDIGIGTAAVGLDLTATELSHITANTFTLQTNNNVSIAGTSQAAGSTMNLIADADNNGSGSITMNSGAIFFGGNQDLALTGQSISTAGTLQTTAGNGDIVLNSASTIAVDGNIYTASGALSLNADSDISATSSGAIASTSGNITLTADADANGSGGIALTNGSTITSTSGAITLLADDDITLSYLQTSRGTANAISVTSQSGALVHAAGSGTNIVDTVAGFSAALNAATGIGNSSAIVLDVTALSVSNGSTGDIRLADPNDWIVGATINNSGSVNGDVALSATGFLNVTGIVTTSVGQIDLNAGTDITLGSAAQITSNSGAINLTADADGNTTGGITLQDATTVSSTSGVIALTAAQNIAVTGVNTGNTAADSVSIVAGGNITDGGTTKTDVITAGGITVTAGGAIGSQADELDVAVSSATLDAGGGVFISDTGTLNLLNLIAGGSVAIDATGDLTLTSVSVNATSSDVVSFASTGAIRDGGDVVTDIDVVGAAVQLSAANGIGDGNALETSVSQLGASNSTAGWISISNDQALALDDVQNAGGNTFIFSNGNMTVNATQTVAATAASNDMMLMAVGDIFVNGDVSVLGGTLTLKALDNLSQGAASVVSSGTGAIVVIADDDVDNVGAITQANGAQIASTSGLVSLDAAQDITLANVATGNSTVAAITVASTLGGIVDGGDTNIDLVAATGGVVLNAVTGIGNGNALETTINSLSASNSTSGAMAIGNTAALALNGISNTGGNIAISSNGDLTVSAAQTVTTTGTSTIALTANNGALNVTGDVTAVNGAITLSAGGDIAQAAASTIASTAGLISLTADNDTNNVGAITQTDGAQITSTSGAIALGAAQNITLANVATGNATASAITVASTQGGIIDGGNTDTDLVAATGGAVLSAATGIGNGNALETTLAQLGASNSTSGAITIGNTTALALNDVSNSGGNIAITSNGNLAVNTTQTVSTTGASSIALTAINGALNVAGDITAVNGATTLTAGNDVTQAAASVISSAAGAITLTADNDANNIGAITQTDGARITSTSGLIVLDAAQNITLANVATGNATASAITVTSALGSIIDGGDTNTDLVAAAGGAVLSAVTGIGSGNALETSISLLGASNSTSGAITINNASALALNDVANTGGNIAISSNGNLAVNATQTVSATGASTIALTANNGALNVAGDVTSVNGALTLSAGSDITQAAASTISSTAGAISLTADNDANNIGAITQTDGAQITSTSGAIALDAAQNITLANIATGNATASAITVISSLGGIIDGGNTDTDLVAATGGAVLSAATGIGSGNALETTLAQLGASNGTSGATAIDNTSALALNDISNTGGNIAISSNGDLAVNATQTIATTGTSTIVLTATTGALNVMGDVTAVDGATTLTAADDVTQAAASVISSAAGAITLTADNDADNIGFITQTDGAQITSTSGTIALDATQDVTLANLATGNSTASAISVTSTQGGIVDGGDADTDLVAASGGAVLSAATGIGNGNALETTISTLGASNGTSGAIAIDNTSALALNDISNSGGNIAISSNGDLAVNATQTVSTTAASTIALTAINGALNVAGDITAVNGAITLTADDNVTQAAASLISSAAGLITLTADNDADNIGAITQTDGAQITSTSGTIALDAAQDITLANVATGNSTAAAITVTSTQGGIVDGGNTDTDLVATTGGAVLSAATGIGNGNALETTLAQLGASNSTSGAITIGNTTALALNDVSNSGGNIAISSNGNLGINATQAVSATGASSIALTAINGALNVAGDITAVNGATALTAADDVTQAATSVISSAAGAITLTADNDADNIGVITQTDGAQITSTSGLIVLDATQDITLANIATGNATASAITVTSALGGILDGGDTNTDLVAASGGAVLSAATGIGNGNALETTLGQLGASNSTSGVIAVDNTLALALNDLSNTGGNIAITSNGNLSVNATQSVTTTGASTITLTASNGALNIAGDVSAVDGAITLTADDGVMQGATSTISSAAGAINLTADNDADNIGAITQTDGAQITSTSGAITLDAAQDITLANVATGNSTTAAITVTSTQGGIIDGGDADIDLVAATGGVVLGAVTGIGSGNALETTISSFGASNSTSGAIALDNTSALTLNDVSNSGGNIAVSSDGDLTLGAGHTVSTTGASTIALTATNGALILTGDVTAANGAITLTADDDVTQAAASVISSTAGAITLTADNDGDNIGAITQTDGAQITSTSGAIALDAAQDITLAHVATGNSTAAAITVTSSLGGIVDGGDTDTDLVAATGGAVLSAATGIGNGNALETTLGQLGASNSTSGVIAVDNTSALALNDVSNTGGNIAITSNGALAVNAAQTVSTMGASTITLTATNGALNVTGDVTAVDGATALTADDDVTQAAASVISSTTGAITLTADNDADNIGAITQTDGAQITSTSGLISLNAAQDITLANVATGNSTAAAITVTSTQGGIVDGGDTDVDLVAAFGGVLLSTATGIGDTNALELSTGSVDVTAQSGNVDIFNQLAAGLTADVQSGSLVYTSADTVTVASVASVGDISLTTTGGNIDIAGNVSSNGGDVSLLAADDVNVTQGVFSADGDILLHADNDADNIGGVTMAAGAQINAGAGRIRIDAADDVTLTGLSTISTQTSAITVSTSGALIDAGDLFRDMSAVQGGVLITAGDVGNGNALDIRTGVIDVAATGDVDITNAGALTITQLSATNALLQVGGNIVVSNAGIDVAAALDLAANGSIDVVNTTIAGDSVAIASTGDMRWNASTLDAVSTITLQADTDNIGGGDISFASQSLIQGHGLTNAIVDANQVTLQTVDQIAALQSDAAATNFTQSAAVDTLTLAGVTTVATGTTLNAANATIDQLHLQQNAALSVMGTAAINQLALGGAGTNNLTLGAATLGSVQGTGAGLAIDANTLQLGRADLATGALAIVANATTADSLITLGDVNAGDVAITGVGGSARSLVVNGTAVVNSLQVGSMQSTVLSNVNSGTQVQVTSDSIALDGDITAANAVMLDGATELLRDVTLTSGRAGSNTGGVFLAGSVNGNSHALSIDAGDNVMCSSDAQISNVSVLTVADSIKAVLGATQAQQIVVNARQEIHLNDNITAQTLSLDADSDDDGIGAIFRYVLASLDVGNLQTSGSIFDIDARANCDFPLCDPVLTDFTDIAREQIVAEQESNARGGGIANAFFAGQLKVSYLDADCALEEDSASTQCRQKKSLYDFLGTFLINNQLPGH